MKKLGFLVISLVLAGNSAVWALDPGMLNLTPAGASALAGFDVARLQASPFGQYLMKTLDQKVPDLDKIVSATGFDPRRDLKEVLVAVGNGSGQGVVIARGAFDQPRLLNLAHTAGVASTTYRGVMILTPQTGTPNQTVAFVAGYLVAGGLGDVQRAIDQASGRAVAAPLGNQALMASTHYDAWVVTSTVDGLMRALPNVGPNGGGAAGGPLGQGLPLRGIRSITGGAQFADGVNIGVEAEASSAQDASSFADLVRLVAVLGQSQGGGQGQAGAPSGTNHTSWLNTLQVSSDGNVVRATVKVSQIDFDNLINNGNGNVQPATAPRARSNRTAQIIAQSAALAALILQK